VQTNPQRQARREPRARKIDLEAPVLKNVGQSRGFPADPEPLMVLSPPFFGIPPR